MKKIPIDKFPKWVQELLNPDVIKSMQIKFVATAMGILIMVFLIMLTSINVIMKTVSQSQSMQLLEKLAESDRYNTLNNDDRPPEDIPPPEDQFRFMPEETTETDVSAETEIVREGFSALAWKPWDEQQAGRFEDGRRPARL